MSDDVIAHPGRPPRNGQFRPGQSGNLKGRPKGSRNIRTYVIKLLDAKIPVIEGGKTRTITRAEAIAIQYVNLATKGDPKSLAAVLNMTREFDDATGEGRSSALMRIEDDEVMEGIIARIRAGDAPLASEPAPNVSAEEFIEHGPKPENERPQQESI
jgi:hypothetical protein